MENGKMEITHVKVIKPTKVLLKKCVDFLKNNPHNHIINIIDYYNVGILKRSKSGRQIVKRYSDYIIGMKSFNDLKMPESVRKNLSETYNVNRHGLLAIEIIEDEIPESNCLKRMWDYYRDFKDYRKPLCEQFQTEELKFIHTNEQLKAVQKHFLDGDEHYINKLKKLPKNSFIEIWYLKNVE